MGRAIEIIDCKFCSEEFSVDKYNVKNIGLPWQPVWIACCPSCWGMNIVHTKKREFMKDFMIENKYDKNLMEYVTVLKKPEQNTIMAITDKIKNDKLAEKYVQYYVKENPKVFGFENLKGPFPYGPDFKGVWNGEEVEIEVERTYTKYKAHKHHLNFAFNKVSILICLDPKRPTKKSIEGLPKNIWYIDHQHFFEWFVEFLERQEKSNILEGVSTVLYDWFRSRLIEEESEYEDDGYDIPIEEYGSSIQIELKTKLLTRNYICENYDKIVHPDFTLYDLDALELLSYYFDEQEKYFQLESGEY